MPGYQPITLKRAKHMRREPTDAEKKLWSKLRGGRLDGWKFRRQQPIGRYIADFVCQASRLIVEVDGSQHADSAYDERRDHWLDNVGYRTLRVWNNDVHHNLEGVCMAISVELTRAPSPSATRRHAAKSSYPLPQGERSDPVLEGQNRK